VSATQGLIFDIRKFSLHDGPGIRTTVFFKGCPLSCTWCHNPESHSFQKEVMLWDSRCIGCGECLGHCPQEAIQAVLGSDGKVRSITDRARCTRCGECIEACAAGARELVGQQMSVRGVMGEIERDRTFYEESGGGATFSGGEPLAQADFLENLLTACKSQDIHTAVDTSGYATWATIDRIRAKTDLFLYDLKLMDDSRHIQYIGVSNRRILANLRALAKHGQRIIVRVPLIPGINDDEDNLRQLGEFTKSLPRLERVDVLPYHPSALGKYERLAYPYSLTGTPQPSEERVQEIVDLLAQYHLTVKIGG